MRARTSTSAWMRAMSIIMICSALVGGCCPPAGDRLNAPPQGQTDRPSDLQDNLVRMGDNALLNERTVSPAHFVLGSVELNSLGVRRLNRFATLLKVYGGPLHYDGLEDEETFAKQRMDRIKDYLVASGVGPDNFNVDWAMAGGGEMRASESSIVRVGTTAVSQQAEARTIERSKRDIIEKQIEKLEAKNEKSGG